MPFIVKNDDQPNNIQQLISITEGHYKSTVKSDLVLMVQEIIAISVRILRNAMDLEHFVSRILEFQC
jgi:hypothetical protein